MPDSASPLTGLTPLEALGSSAFSRVAEARQADGNAVRLLCDAVANYPAWLGAIAEARHTVHLENYIIAEDEVGGLFAAALTDAVRRGVHCRVLYDWLGCRQRTSARFWTALRAAGVEVRCYNPPHLGNPLAWISRDHRKLLCVDRQIAFTGGLCIGRDWAGDPSRNLAPWRDTAVEVRGPAVAHFEAAFADSWATAGPPPPDPDGPPSEAIEPAGDLSMWVIAGHPNSMGLYRLEQLIAEIVVNSLWLSDAYFVATTGYVRALCGAARAGVDVRLLVPGTSNWPLVRTLSQAGYRPLLEAGVRVFEWNGPMMHAKTAVADGCWTRIGSSNSNFASWISNRELDVTIKDRAFAKEMEAQYERDLANATEVMLDAGRRRASAATSPPDPRIDPWRTAAASRLVAGVVGLGNIVGATVSQHRTPGPAEAIVLSVAAALLIILSLTAFLLPRLLAYPLGLVAAGIGAVILGRAWKLRPFPPRRGSR
jgi:cardiolipin synthase